MRLNRFLASTGISSRRKADELIFAQKIRVNGEVVDNPATRVSENDRVEVDNQTVKTFKEKIYLAIIKPVGVVSTCHDPHSKVIILDLLNKTPFKKYRKILKPVGRLDQNTSGVILLTNDGELHYRLTHPSMECVKEYEVELTTPMALAVLKKVRQGMFLEDGFIKPDLIDYVNPRIKHVIRIRLHSGKNRIIRRMMEKINMVIKTLKRIKFANITLQSLLKKTGKKDLKINQKIVFSLHHREVEELKKLVGLAGPNK